MVRWAYSNPPGFRMVHNRVWVKLFLLDYDRSCFLQAYLSTRLCLR